MSNFSKNEEAYSSDEDWKQELDVDLIIKKLTDARMKPSGTEINLDENQIVLLIDEVIKVFLSQPILLELDGPINICGMECFGSLILQVTSMVSFMTCCGCSNSTGILPKWIISFWGTKSVFSTLFLETT